MAYDAVAVHDNELIGHMGLRRTVAGHLHHRLQSDAVGILLEVGCRHRRSVDPLVLPDRVVMPTNEKQFQYLKKICCQTSGSYLW